MMDILAMFWVILKTFFLVPDVIIPVIVVGIITFFLCLKFGKNDNRNGGD